MKSCFIDHFVITAPTLEAGTELVKKLLGVNPQKGGEPPRSSGQLICLICLVAGAGFKPPTFWL